MPQQTINSIETGLSLRTKLNANFAELYSLFANSGSTFDPKTIPALTLWLDASDSSTLFDASVGGSNVVTQDAPVTRWKDKSGNNFDMLQSVENSKPVLKTAFINGKNSIRFDGINDLMTSNANFHNYSSFTCFMVSKSVGAATLSIGGLQNGKGGLLSSNFGGSGGVFGNYGQPSSYLGTPSNLTVLTSGIWKNLTFTGILNGQKGSTSSTINMYSSFLQVMPVEIGITSRQNEGTQLITAFCNADYCEILIYGTELTSIQRQQIELYLNQKWAIF